jgi:ketosteroid isomerase-like protein
MPSSMHMRTRRCDFDLAPAPGPTGHEPGQCTARLAGCDGSIQIEARNVSLTVDSELAFVSALNRMRGRQGGEEQALWYRTTMGLR